MPLILNEDDVHALQPAASPCLGWVRDSTNSPPGARCEAPGRARRPPHPPSPPRDAPRFAAETRETRKTQTPRLPGGAASASAALAMEKKGPQLRRPGGGPPAPGDGGRGGVCACVCPHALPTRNARNGAFPRPALGKVVPPPFEMRGSFPTGTRDHTSPFPMSMSPVLRGGLGSGGGGVQLPRVSAGRVGGRVGGKEPPPAGSARSAERGRSPWRSRLWARK